VDEENLTHNWI